MENGVERGFDPDPVGWVFSRVVVCGIASGVTG